MNDCFKPVINFIGTTRANADAIYGRIYGLITTMGNGVEIRREQKQELETLYNNINGEYDTYENLSEFIESNKLSDSIIKIFNLELSQMGRPPSELLPEISIPRATVFLHELLTSDHPNMTPDNYDEVEARKRFNETEEETNERLRSEIPNNEDNGWRVGGRRHKRSKKSRKSKKSKRSRKSKRSKKSRRR